MYTFFLDTTMASSPFFCSLRITIDNDSWGIVLGINHTTASSRSCQYTYRFGKCANLTHHTIGMLQKYWPKYWSTYADYWFLCVVYTVYIHSIYIHIWCLACLANITVEFWWCKSVRMVMAVRKLMSGCPVSLLLSQTCSGFLLSSRSPLQMNKPQWNK